jgi:hypothetical protein
VISNVYLSDGTSTFPVAEIPSFSINVIPVSEPGTALLMGFGLAGLAGASRRRE